jgi:hypothetical protein
MIIAIEDGLSEAVVRKILSVLERLASAFT